MERKREEEELISYREASRKRRRRLAVSRKKRNALKTLSRAIFSEWRGGEEGGHSTFEWNCSDGGRGGGRRRKLIRRKAVPGGISFEFSEHRGNSVSVTFSFSRILDIDGYFFFPCSLSGKEFDFFLFSFFLRITVSWLSRDIRDVGTWKNPRIILVVVSISWNLIEVWIFFIYIITVNFNCSEKCLFK